VIFLAVIFLSLTAIEVIRWAISADPLVISLDQVENLSVKGFSRSTSGVSFTVENPGSSQLILPLDGTVDGMKLRLEFASIDKTIKLINIFPSRQERGFSIQKMVTTRVLPLTRTYEFDLSPHKFDKLQIDFQTNGVTSSGTLKSISLHPVHAFDRTPLLYVLALLSGVLTILPGTLIYCLIARRDADISVYLCSVFALSLLFYTVLFLVLLVGRELIPNYQNVIVLTTFLVSLLGLLLLIARFARLSYLAAIVRDSRQVLISYGVLALLVCYVVSHDTDLPMANVHYSSIAGTKTYNMFRAHDNYFQYLNGKIIADDDSFEKYYGDRRTRKLFYLPQEREMYPGALYATFRSGINALSAYVGESYLTYTLLGSCFNLMVLFPLLAFARKYFPDHSLYLFAIAISLNAFAFTNFYFTWFKFAGAALFLCGLFFLANSHRRPANWAAAGFSFGIGSSMHAGNALGIPLFFLWFVYQNIREYKFANWRWIVGPVLLVSVFVLTNLPYSMVKQHYFTEDHTLLKTFFLAGMGHPDGLWASVKLFFQSIPLTEQLPVRLNNVAQLFRLDSVIEVLTLAGFLDWKEFTFRWNGLEFARLTMLFFPSLFFLALGWLYARVTTGPTPCPLPDTQGPKPTTLVLLGFSAFALIMFMSYGRHEVYFSHSHPMGVILLIHLLLVGLVLSQGHLVSRLYGVYLGFSALRLFSHL